MVLIFFSLYLGESFAGIEGGITGGGGDVAVAAVMALVFVLDFFLDKSAVDVDIDLCSGGGGLISGTNFGGSFRGRPLATLRGSGSEAPMNSGGGGNEPLSLSVPALELLAFSRQLSVVCEPMSMVFFLCTLFLKLQLMQ